MIVSKAGLRGRRENLNHLIRCDSRSTHGWQLRVPSWHPEGPYSLLFSDSKYGSSDAALREAQAERDRVFKDFPPIPIKHRRGPPGRKNRSKLTGVFLQKDKPRVQSSWVWVCIWTDSNGKSCRKTFSVSAHGYEVAFWSAATLRQQMTGIQFTIKDLHAALALGRETLREDGVVISRI